MNIQIRAQGLTMTPKIKDYLKRRLSFALKSRSDVIQQVKVALSDINGPKGGDDKRCKLKIVLKQLPPVFIKDTRNNIFGAIDQACERAVRTINKKIVKQRTKRRSFVPVQELLMVN